MALGQACSKHVQACASMPFSRQSQVKTKAQACASMHKLAKRFQMHACASLHRQARSKRATSMPQAWTSLPKGSKCILAQACKRSMHMLAASLQNKLAILVWVDIFVLATYVLTIRLSLQNAITLTKGFELCSEVN